MRSSDDASPQPARPAWAPPPTGLSDHAEPVETDRPDVRARRPPERRRTALGLCVGGAVAGVLILGTLVARAVGTSTTSGTAAAVPAQPTTGAPPLAAAGTAATATPAPVLPPMVPEAAAVAQRTTTAVPARASSVGDGAGTSQPVAGTTARATGDPVTLGATPVLSVSLVAPTPSAATTALAGSIGPAGAAGLGASATAPSSSVTPRTGAVVTTPAAGAQVTPRTTAPSGATPVRTPSAEIPSAGFGVRQAPPAATPGAAASASGQRVHTVQGGDTLLALAVRYQTTVAALVAANNLKTPDAILGIGQALVLPSAVARAPQAPAAATPSAAASASGQRVHTVQGGDTLLALAVRYHTSVQALVTANNLKTPDTTLAVGQALVLP